MKTNNVILEKPFAFALEIMSTAKSIRELCDYDLASQLWRAGASIGANIEEAQTAQSRPDFLSKMSIAAKEAREIHYWLRLTSDGKVLPLIRLASMIADIEEIKHIITSIVKSSAK